MSVLLSPLWPSHTNTPITDLSSLRTLLILPPFLHSFLPLFLGRESLNQENGKHNNLNEFGEVASNINGKNVLIGETVDDIMRFCNDILQMYMTSDTNSNTCSIIESNFESTLTSNQFPDPSFSNIFFPVKSPLTDALSETNQNSFSNNDADAESETGYLTPTSSIFSQCSINTTGSFRNEDSIYDTDIYGVDERFVENILRDTVATTTGKQPVPCLTSTRTYQQQNSAELTLTSSAPNTVLSSSYTFPDILELSSDVNSNSNSKSSSFSPTILEVDSRTDNNNNKNTEFSSRFTLPTIHYFCDEFNSNVNPQFPWIHVPQEDS